MTKGYKRSEAGTSTAKKDAREKWLEKAANLGVKESGKWRDWIKEVSLSNPEL